MDIDKTKRQVEAARAYARLWFNADQEEDHLLAPPTFQVTFPDVDRMVVVKRNYGKLIILTEARYRLAFCRDGTLEWIGELIHFGHAVAPIKIVLDRDGSVMGRESLELLRQQHYENYTKLIVGLGSSQQEIE